MLIFKIILSKDFESFNNLIILLKITLKIINFYFVKISQ